MQLIRPTYLKSKCQTIVQCLALAVLSTSPALADPAEKKELFSGYGVNNSISAAEASKAAGATIITIPTKTLVPDASDEEFAKTLEQLKTSKLPIYACNTFMPNPRNCVGEDADHEVNLKWAESVFSRLQQLDAKMVIWGSGGTRRLKNGWPVEKADAQFISLLKRVGPIAKKYGIVVALEQLRSEECNYINTIGEAAKIIRAVDHPNIRLLADFYHMSQEGDTPEDLKAAADLLVHVEIAEKEGRTYPGVKGDDFRPFFRVLRDAGYNGAVSIEGNGKLDQLAPAIQEIKKQAAEVMAEKK
jgi:sugar phosphate isomerase/epimerase